ncbi:HAD family hydrolase [uncultured Clostridium sp.]|uniref:HAD family hydrolase n=1 Tax=uncultured Clostridium sp. TaxID=59620 RepID=UPI00260C4CB6|nr:HAD family hydrolase [uncultured Clostridium sp.]
MFEGILLVTDMDGSLLNDKKEISKKDMESIEFFEKNGGKFTIATGRIVDSAREYVEKITINFPVIVYNGGKVFDYRNEKSLSERTLSREKKEVLNKILEDKLNVGIEVYADEIVYIVKETELTDRPALKPCTVEFNVPEDFIERNWNKILLTGDKEYIDEVEKNFSKYGVGRAIRSGKCFLEVLPDGVSKLTGIREAMKVEGMEDYKLVTVGDDLNDREMILGADFGFVMENANKELLKEAKYVGTNNNNDPITYIIEFLQKNLVHN